MNRLAAQPVPSRLTHVLAMLTVATALPLVLFGAEVTTKGVGMVDPVSLRTPWHLFSDWFSHFDRGWFIEHGHRTIGWLVGGCALAAFIAACVFDRRRWVILLSFAAGLAVLTQGALGIFRIQMNSLFGNTTAVIHGAFAPVVLSVLLTLALATASRWQVGEMQPAKARLLRTWCIVTVLATFVQLVLGGFIRHKDQLLAGRLHLIGAFVVFSFLWVVIKVAREANYESFKTLSRVIMALLTIQVLLGAEAWMAWMKRHFVPSGAIDESQAMQFVRSAHYVVGAFIFASTVALTAKALWAPARLEAAP